MIVTISSCFSNMFSWLNIDWNWFLCSITCVPSGVHGAHSAASGHILLRCRLHLLRRCQEICSAVSVPVLCFLCSLHRRSDSPQLLWRLSPQAPVELDCAGEGFEQTTSSIYISIISHMYPFLCLVVHLNAEPLLHGGHDCQLLQHRHRRHGGGHHSSGLLHCRHLLTSGRHPQLT